MSLHRLARSMRVWLAAGAVVAGTSACWSVEDPTADLPVGGKVIVYGRITNANGVGLATTRVTVRHHPALCAGRINESETVITNEDGRYRAVITAVTTPGCVSVKAQPNGADAIPADSVMDVRAPFRPSEPLDSIVVNLTLRGGGIQ